MVTCRFRSDNLFLHGYKKLDALFRFIFKQADLESGSSFQCHLDVSLVLLHQLDELRNCSNIHMLPAFCWRQAYTLRAGVASQLTSRHQMIS